MPLPYAWSENASHIQSLYRPWQEGDGYAEEVIRTAEAQIGGRLPATLRRFYGDWGARDDLIHMHEYLLSPQEIVVSDVGILFCQENQSTMYWGIKHSELDEADPPVYFAETENWDRVRNEPIVGPWRLSHEQISHFLDALTYFHAFAHGAAYGGRSCEPAEEQRKAVLEQYWQRLPLRSVPWGFYPDAYPRCWPIYVCPYQAIWQAGEFLVAAGTQSDFDEIGRVLGITWKGQW